MDLEKIATLVEDLKAREMTVEQAIEEAEQRLKLLRGLKQMTAAPKEASKPRTGRKGAAGKGEAAEKVGA